MRITPTKALIVLLLEATGIACNASAIESPDVRRDDIHDERKIDEPLDDVGSVIRDSLTLRLYGGTCLLARLKIAGLESSLTAKCIGSGDASHFVIENSAGKTIAEGSVLGPDDVVDEGVAAIVMDNRTCVVGGTFSWQ